MCYEKVFIYGSNLHTTLVVVCLLLSAAVASDSLLYHQKLQIKRIFVFIFALQITFYRSTRSSYKGPMRGRLLSCEQSW